MFSKIGRYLYALPFGVFGILHFVNAGQMAGMVPMLLVDGDVAEIHHPGGAVRTELQEELDPLSSVGSELTEYGLLSVLIEYSDYVGRIVGVESADESPYLLAIHVVEYVSLDRLWKLEEHDSLSCPR